VRSVIDDTTHRQFQRFRGSTWPTRRLQPSGYGTSCYGFSENWSL